MKIIFKSSFFINYSNGYQSNKLENNYQMISKIQNGINYKNNYADEGNKEETILLNQGNINILNKGNDNNPSSVKITPISESLSANSKTTFINIDGEYNEKLDAENLNDSIYLQHVNRKKYIKKYFKMRNVFMSLFSEYGFILVIVMFNIIIGYFTVILVIRKVLFMNK